MPLSTLLYRCPICGTDPVDERPDDRVVCPGCSAQFEPAPPNGECRIRIRTSGAIHDIQAAVLTRRIDRMGGSSNRAADADGRLQARASVRAQFVSVEVPLRFRERLLGFVERLAPPTAGELVLDGPTMEFHTPGDVHRWAVEDIRSLQTSSSAVQVSLGTRGVILFRFPGDSVRRWDHLVRSALQRRWHQLGRGRIVEFQPRVRTGT